MRCIAASSPLSFFVAVGAIFFTAPFWHEARGRTHTRSLMSVGVLLVPVGPDSGHKKVIFCSVYSFSSSCPKTVSRTREVFPTGSTTLLRLQLSRTRDCAHRSRHVGLLLFFFFLERKVPAQSKLKRVTLQPLALRTRFDHLKARFVFPGKRSWLAEGYWHMLLEAI